MALNRATDRMRWRKKSSKCINSYVGDIMQIRTLVAGMITEKGIEMKKTSKSRAKEHFLISKWLGSRRPKKKQLYSATRFFFGRCLNEKYFYLPISAFKLYLSCVHDNVWHNMYIFFFIILVVSFVLWRKKKMDFYIFHLSAHMLQLWLELLSLRFTPLRISFIMSLHFRMHSLSINNFNGFFSLLILFRSSSPLHCHSNPFAFIPDAMPVLFRCCYVSMPRYFFFSSFICFILSHFSVMCIYLMFWICRRSRYCLPRVCCATYAGFNTKNTRWLCERS